MPLLDGDKAQEILLNRSVHALLAGAVASAALLSVGFGVNIFYLEPKMRSEFNTRAQNTLTAHHLKTLQMSDFKYGANGCGRDLYGAQIVAEDKEGKIVYATACVSRTTEMKLTRR